MWLLPHVSVTAGSGLILGHLFMRGLASVWISNRDKHKNAMTAKRCPPHQLHVQCWAEVFHHKSVCKGLKPCHTSAFPYDAAFSPLISCSHVVFQRGKNIPEAFIRCFFFSSHTHTHTGWCHLIFYLIRSCIWACTCLCRSTLPATSCQSFINCFKSVQGGCLILFIYYLSPYYQDWM